MGGKSDEIKGRVKEAAGALTGDNKLRREGKFDRRRARSSKLLIRSLKRPKTLPKT